MVVLHVQTEESPHGCADKHIWSMPRMTWCKTDRYSNKDFSPSPYLQTDLHFLGQHWRVSSVLALMLGPSQLPDPTVVLW